VPQIANPKAPPRWKTVDDSGTFLWHDHRMHYTSTSTPPQVTDKGRKTKIFDYTIPLRIDGRKGAIDGTLYWVGSPQTSKLPFVIAGIVILLGGGGLVLLARRRRGAGDGPGAEDSKPAREAW
jgi:LPXTG-motif cell wall-anchored protein